MGSRTVALLVVLETNIFMVVCRKKYCNFISDIVFIAIVWGRLRPVTPGSEICSHSPVETR